MRTRTLLATALIALVGVGTLADAAPPKPPKGFTQNVSFTDNTPDPTGNTADTEAEHCNGLLPKEAPILVKIPGPGDVEVTLAGFQGDWTLQINDAKGELMAGADVNPPDYESTGVRLKKAATIQVLPCNLAGTPTAKVTIKYSYRK